MAGVLLLVIVGAGVVYGVTATRRESAYLDVIERGDAALTRDDSFAAIEAFTVAIALKSDSMLAHLKRGEAYRRRREFESALRDLRRASELDPLATQPRELLGDVNYAMGRYARATAQYAEYTALDDRSPRLFYKLALASFQLGQVPAAIRALEKSVALDDRFAEGHYLLGVCLRETQQSNAALKSFLRAVELQPALLQAREELADLYGRLGRPDERARQLEALAALDPRPSREVTLGLVYARGGQLDRAITRLGSAAERFPDAGYTYVALGRVWLERAAQGDRIELRKALGALEAAVGSDSSSEALTLLGRALLMSGDAARAEQVLLQATTRFPVDVESFYYLAEAADRRGHLPIAQRALIDFAALERVEAPKFDARLLARLADAHLRSGDAPAARRAAERSLEKDPRNTAARSVLARAQ